MLDFETGCLENREAWLRLLAAYALAEDLLALERKAAVPVPPPSAVVANSTSADSAEVEETATGWVARVSTLDGVEPADLSPLHGRLIALGLLKFQLVDRQVGLRYRLTPDGRRAVVPADREAVRAA